MPTTPSPLAQIRRVVAVVAAAALMSSCGVSSGELPRAPAAPRLTGGSGLVLAAAVSPAELFAYDLATKRKIAFQLPPGTEEVVAGHWVAQGSALVALRGEDGIAVYRVGSSQRPQPIANTIQATSFDFERTRVLASSCRSLGPPPGVSPGRFRPSGPDRQTGRVHLLDVKTGGGWATVAEGCVAALSPGADQVAYSPEGLTLWVGSLGDDSKRKVMDVRDLDLQPASGNPFTIKGPIEWSEGGVSVAIDADGSDRIVRLSAAGEVQDIIRIDPQSRDFFLGLASSPDGERLAIPTYTYLGYVNATGSVLVAENGVHGYRVLSVQPFASGEAVWAPDGRSLLLSGEASDPWIVTDVTGTWLQRVPGLNALPLDWTES